MFKKLLLLTAHLFRFVQSALGDDQWYQIGCQVIGLLSICDFKTVGWFELAFNLEDNLRQSWNERHDDMFNMNDEW